MSNHVNFVIQNLRSMIRTEALTFTSIKKGGYTGSFYDWCEKQNILRDLEELPENNQQEIINYVNDFIF